MTEWFLCTLRVVSRHFGEDLRPRVKAKAIDAVASCFKYGPKARSLFRTQAVLAPKAWHLGIGCRTVELPRINHVSPFGEQEASRELGNATLLRGFGERTAHLFLCGSVRTPSCHELIKLLGHAQKWDDHDLWDDR